MKKYYTILSILLLVAFTFLNSCQKETENIHLDGTIISIQYNPYKIKYLDNEDMYIIIDGRKYSHIKNLQNTQNKNSLPSYSNVLMNIEGKELKEKGNIISISSVLFKHLFSTNEYTFINPQALKLQGKILLKRKDSKKIKIEFPKDYPLNYKITN